ncbi:MAG: hypothetical protein H0V53_00395 [Rubrobacter sp.]|jgi:S1-C subfamily serine protease|nr:hypothetical protein [Rubrobacter sp.]
MEVFENLSASSRLPRAELDAYSRTVRDVTGSLEPAVISIGTTGGRGGPGGARSEPRSGGSGVIIGVKGSAATAVTNSHVVRGLGRSGGSESLRIVGSAGGALPGDVILGFGEETVRSTGDLLRRLDEPAIGRDTTLRVLKGGREVPVEVRPTEAPERTAG